MAKRISLLVALVALAAPAAGAAKVRKARFVVSLYGVQRFEQTTVEKPSPDPSACYDAKGTTRAESVVRFHSRKPVKYDVVTGLGKTIYVGRAPSDRNGNEIALAGTQSISVSSNRQIKNCAGELDRGWYSSPPAGTKGCGSKALVEGAATLAVHDPWALAFSGAHATGWTNCTWGDQSGELYRAGVRRDIGAELLRAGKTVLILRNTRKHHEAAANGGSVDEVRRTTVYVTFRKIGAAP